MTSAYDPANPLADASPCPHCGAFARIVKSDELRFVCGVCGAPRIPAQDLSGRELEPLKAAQAARRSRFLWRFGGLFAGAVGGAGMLMTVLLALILGWGGFAFGFALTLPFIVLAIVALARVGGKSTQISEALKEAWKSATRDVVMRAEHGVTPAHLAKALPLSEAGAESLLTEISVEDAFQSRITDEGKIVVMPVGGTSLRIDAGAQGAARTIPEQPVDPLEARFAELEQSMAEEDAAGEKAKRQNQS